MFRCKIYLVWPVRLWQGIRRQKAQNTGEESQNLVMGDLQSFLGYSDSFWSSYNGLVRGMKTGVGVSFSGFWKTVITTPPTQRVPILTAWGSGPSFKTSHKHPRGWDTDDMAGGAGRPPSLLGLVGVEQALLRRDRRESEASGCRPEQTEWLRPEDCRWRQTFPGEGFLAGGSRLWAWEPRGGAVRGYRLPPRVLGALWRQQQPSWSLGGPRTRAVASTPGLWQPGPQ